MGKRKSVVNNITTQVQIRWTLLVDGGCDRADPHPIAAPHPSNPNPPPDGGQDEEAAGAVEGPRHRGLDAEADQVWDWTIDGLRSGQPAIVSRHAPFHAPRVVLWRW